MSSHLNSLYRVFAFDSTARNLQYIFIDLSVNIETCILGLQNAS